MGIFDKIRKVVDSLTSSEQASALSADYGQGHRMLQEHIAHMLRRSDWYQVKVESTPTAKAILDSSMDMRVAVVLAGFAEHGSLINRIRASSISYGADGPGDSYWTRRQFTNGLLTLLLRAKLPFNEAQAAYVAGVAARTAHREEKVYAVRIAGLIPPPLSRELRSALLDLKNSLDQSTVEMRKVAGQIDVLLGETPVLPLRNGEPWGDAVLAEVAEMPSEEMGAWAKLLAHAASATAAKPSKKWMDAALALVDPIGRDAFGARLKSWFRLFADTPVLRGDTWQESARMQGLQTDNAIVVKGLVWASVSLGVEIVKPLGDLALISLKKIPDVGPKSEKVGNACIVALGMMESLEAAAQLSRLNARVRYRQSLTLIARALQELAERSHLTASEIEEMCAPTFGLDEAGVRREELGGCAAELRLVDSVASLSWWSAEGRPVKSAPAEAKQGFADEVKELTAAVKEIKGALGVEKARIERLFLEDRSWTAEVWRERYADHPLVGSLARRLIWAFEDASGRAVAGMPRGGEVVDVGGRPLDWITPQTCVRIWHPLGVDPEVVLAWRRGLEEAEIVQPFKQAHRELYIITDAEVSTATYSNRFAAHILRQHQFAALCRERGWAYRLMGNFDSQNTPTRHLPQYDMRVEYWVECAPNALTSETGIALDLSTDQVRFCDLGGNPRPLVDIPPILFSELMRDVDLFVGVCSIGNDPAWIDAGAQPVLGAYWREYSFGNLNATALTRRDILARLLPKLKIAGRARLEEKYLVVDGRLRSYKIHLGSSNILMSPNDQYLCIVPGRGGDTPAKVFLPFEGDTTLAVILSKAFLLADDDKIKDPTIVSQIKR